MIRTLYMSGFRSVQVGLGVLDPVGAAICPFEGTGPGPSRSHLISAVEFDCLNTISLLSSLFLCSSFFPLSLLLFLPDFPSFHREISSQDRLGLSRGHSERCATTLPSVSLVLWRVRTGNK